MYTRKTLIELNINTQPLCIIVLNPSLKGEEELDFSTNAQSVLKRLLMINLELLGIKSSNLI